MKKLSLFFVSLLLLVTLLFNLSSCLLSVKAADLMEGIEAREIAYVSLDEKNGAAVDFAIRLFQEVNDTSGSVLISPLSVLCSLSMTLNGASGDTLAQMEKVLGMQRDELNSYLYTYVDSLPNADKYKMNLANSIWFKDDLRFSVKNSFLQANADYYGADIYKTSFSMDTLKDINNWVNNKTDGMIPNIIDRIPEETIMYIVNALAFEAEWQKTYRDYQVSDGSFTREDGSKCDAEFMYCNEYSYLEDEGAVGFIKYYKDSKYAFAALLPDENLSLLDYVNSLSGDRVAAMLENPERIKVETKIPKFEIEYSTELSEVLSKMGMPLAFDEDNADFSELGTYFGGNIYIGSVIHKTYIELGENGTRAGAATVVQMNGATSAGPGEEYKVVYLDRPFVYMLIDCENNLPFFIGTVTEISK